MVTKLFIEPCFVQTMVRIVVIHISRKKQKQKQLSSKQPVAKLEENGFGDSDEDLSDEEDTSGEEAAQPPAKKQ